MARRLKSDAVLFAATLILVVVGLAWIYSITAEHQVGPRRHPRQAGDDGRLGIVGLLVAMRIDYHCY